MAPLAVMSDDDEVPDEIWDMLDDLEAHGKVRFAGSAPDPVSPCMRPLIAAF